MGAVIKKCKTLAKMCMGFSRHDSYTGFTIMT
jgi:hypothetical protein